MPHVFVYGTRVVVIVKFHHVLQFQRHDSSLFSLCIDSCAKNNFVLLTYVIPRTKKYGIVFEVALYKCECFEFRSFCPGPSLSRSDLPIKRR